MFEISVEHSFAAGHALRGYKGKCENVHGHNYKIRVTVAGGKLNSTGLLMDFVDLRAAIRELAERLDHRFMNDIPPFDTINPSAENLARYFSEGLEPQIRILGNRVASVTVWETDTTSATFIPTALATGFQCAQLDFLGEACGLSRGIHRRALVMSSHGDDQQERRRLAGSGRARTPCGGKKIAPTLGKNRYCSFWERDLYYSPAPL